MKLRLFLPFFALCSQIAGAAGPVWPITDYPRHWMFGEGFYALSLDGTYVNSSENYDANGATTQPPTMNNIQFTNARAHGALGFAPSLSLFGQVSGSSSVTQNAEGSGIPDGKNIGAGDGFLAARYLLYRSSAANRELPTDWRKNSFLVLIEPSWVFPLYNKPDLYKPARGEQGSDLTGILRAAFFLDRWFALSSSVGYTKRSSGYASEIPYSLRGDVYLAFRPYLRGWFEWKGNFSREDHALTGIANASNPDQIPGGSLLFKGINSETSMLGGGLGIIVSKNLELVGAVHQTIAGINSAVGTFFSLGLAYRPYESLEREAPPEPVQKPMVVAKKEIPKDLVQYAYSVPVQDVSVNKNFIRIGRGSKQGLKMGDEFHLFAPSKPGVEKPAAIARVVSVKENTSYLKVESVLIEDTKLNTEFEARRIIDQP